MTDYQRIFKNDYVRTAVAIALVVTIGWGFFFGLGVALGSAVPVRVVESGSMCIDPNGCDGWSHPFGQTLHVGDIIIVQSVNPEELNANYPNSDIIVYQKPSLRDSTQATPIVHRIVGKYQVDGIWYFQTKGDGNGVNWPTAPTSSEYDSRTLWNTGQGVPQDLVLGKVLMRIPYFGWITLFMQSNSWTLPLIVAVIILLVIIEFVIPVIRAEKKKNQIEQQKDMVKAP